MLRSHRCTGGHQPSYSQGVSSGARLGPLDTYTGKYRFPGNTYPGSTPRATPPVGPTRSTRVTVVSQGGSLRFSCFGLFPRHCYLTSSSLREMSTPFPDGRCLALRVLRPSPFLYLRGVSQTFLGRDCCGPDTGTF